MHAYHFFLFLKNRLEVFFFPQRNTRELVLFFGLACSAGVFCVFTNQRDRVDSTSRWFSLSGQRGGREEEEDLIFSSPPLPHQSSFSLTPTPLDAFSSLCWNPRWCLLDQNVLTHCKINASSLYIFQNSIVSCLLFHFVLCHL